MKGEVEWKNSVAVLPFADLSPQKDQDYFCEGIAEELINGFSKIEKLRVASRTSSFQFKDQGYDITEVGRKLKVQYVLEGSVRKSGNRLRITAQLVNANDGYHLWSEKYDRDLEDIFTIQDEISLAIVKELRIKLVGEEKAALLKRHTEKKEAYSAYLKGLYFWNRRSEVGFEKALTFYRQAIEIDPLYALPYIGIADTYNISGHFCFLPPKDAFAKAHAAASKALEIDETIGEAHASIGWVFTYSGWDWELAESEFKQAIELSPNYATGHEWYALFLMDMGRFDKAIREIKRALELDPISSMINAVGGIVYLCSRQYDKAVEQFLKTIELDPNFPWAYQWLGLAYGAKQIYDKATKSLEKAASLAKDMPFGLGLLGMAYGWEGQKNEAIKVLEKLDSLSDKKYVSPMHKTFVYIGLEEKNKVFEYLDKAYTERDPMLVYAKVGPWMDYCRSDPRYDALLEKMRLKA
jgi:adenylate cyclase